MTGKGIKRRDEVRPVDPIKAIWNWRRRGFTDREIAEIVSGEMRTSFGRHPVTAEGCVEILKVLGDG